MAGSPHLFSLWLSQHIGPFAFWERAHLRQQNVCPIGFQARKSLLYCFRCKTLSKTKKLNKWPSSAPVPFICTPLLFSVKNVLHPSNIQRRIHAHTEQRIGPYVLCFFPLLFFFFSNLKMKQNGAKDSQGKSFLRSVYMNANKLNFRNLLFQDPYCMKHLLLHIHLLVYETIM